jgi:hypothetical protein
MAHVGIERFGSSQRQHDRAHGQEGPQRLFHEESGRVQRVDHRQDDARLVRDMDEPEHGQDTEIEDHHRTEHQPDAGRPARLDGKQADQDPDRDWDDERLHAHVDCGQALHRREHGHRRRDHRIAVEQRGREHAEHDDAVGPALFAAHRPVDQREEREAAAFSLIVRAHDDHDVFERDDDHHRPEDHRKHSVDVELIRGQGVMPGERLPERVDR